MIAWLKRIIRSVGKWVREKEFTCTYCLRGFDLPQETKDFWSKWGLDLDKVENLSCGCERI